MTRLTTSILLIAICSSLSGCFTTLHWLRFKQRRGPEELISAELRQDNVIRLLIRYNTGNCHLLLADLNPPPSRTDYNTWRKHPARRMDASVPYLYLGVEFAAASDETA